MNPEHINAFLNEGSNRYLGVWSRPFCLFFLLTCMERRFARAGEVFGIIEYHCWHLLSIWYVVAQLTPFIALICA